ncbi:hypothetical protein Hanom_Chr17g01564481 [Helianthus anomalus]
MISITMMLETQNSVNFFQSLHSFSGPYKETRVKCLGFLAAIYSTSVGRHHGFIHHIWNCFMNTRTHALRRI